MLQSMKQKNVHSTLIGGSLLLLLLSMACHPRQSGSPVALGLTSATFVGTWVASTVDIAIHGKNGSGPDDAIHFESKALAADQGRKPAITTFAADGGYREETYNMGDSLVRSTVGFWHFYSDTLFMRPDVDNGPKIAFKTELKGNSLRLLSRVDWDADGSKDDEMAVVLKRP